MVSTRQLTFCFAFLLITSAECSVSIENNGYSGLLVAVSEHIPQPEDGGLAFVSQLQDILKETSAALYQATNHRAYFRSIDIVLPSSWNAPIAGVEVVDTRSRSFKSADLRIGYDEIRTQTNSSKYMGIAVDDVLSSTAIQDQSRVLLKKWFKYRYDIDFDSQSRYFYEAADEPGMVDYVVSIVQNVLQGSKNPPLERSADFLYSNAPRNDINPLPIYRFVRVKPFVIYMAVDTSKPVGTSSMTTIKNGLKALIRNFEPTDPIRFAVASFEGTDKGAGSYLQEKIPPTSLTNDGLIDEAINGLQSSSTESNRDVGAALRDAIEKLRAYKDQGGSILYFITFSQSLSSVLELDVVENLLASNIQLVAGEGGAGTHKALERFSFRCNAKYYAADAFSLSLFSQINRVTTELAAADPLKVDRQTIFTESNDISSGSEWSGSFQVAADMGTNTEVAFHSPIEGSFTLSIDGPDGSSQSVTSGPSSTNWNDPAATDGLASLKVSSLDGEWKFRIVYDSSSCTDCSPSASVKLQVTSSSFTGIRTTPGGTTGSQTSAPSDATTKEIASTSSMSTGQTTDPSVQSTTQTDPSTTAQSSTTYSSSSEGTTTVSTTSTTQRTETSTGTTQTTTWTTMETTVCIPFNEFRSKEAEKKVIYVAVDTSFPIGNNPISIVKNALKALVLNVPQDVYFAVADFQGTDTGAGSYLQEKIGLTQISSDPDAIDAAINSLATSSAVYSRDVGAALRDAIEKIKSYKDEDGSILYLITAISSDADSSVMELDIADSLINNRIQLAVVEAGTEIPVLALKSSERLSFITNGLYNYTSSYGTVAFFKSIHDEMMKIVQDPIETERRVLLYDVHDVGDSDVTGSFTIDDTSNVDVVVALQSPKDANVTVEITSPDGESLSLDSDEDGNNWNAPGTIIGVSSLNLPSPVASGRWSYVISSDIPGFIAVQVTSTLTAGETTEKTTTEHTTLGNTSAETTSEDTTSEMTTTEESTTNETPSSETTTVTSVSTTTKETTIDSGTSTTSEITTTSEATTTDSGTSTTSEITTTSEATTSLEVTSTEYSTTICYTSTTIMTTITDGHSSTTDYTSETETTEETIATGASTDPTSDESEATTELSSTTTENPGLGTGEIVGIAVGSAAGAAIIIGGSVYAVKRSSRGGSSGGFTSPEAAAPPPPTSASVRPPPPVAVRSTPSYPSDPPSKPPTDYGRLEPSAGRSLPKPALAAQPEHFIQPSLYDQIDEVEIGVTFEDEDAILTAL